MGAESGPGEGRRWLAPIGGTLAVAGTVGVVLALTTLVWFDFSHPGVYTDISRAQDFANSPHGPRFERMYAQWLGWALLSATVLSGVACLFMRRGKVALRALSVMLGLVGAVASALNFVSMTNNFYGDWHQVLGGMSVGIPVAAVGFLALAVGLAIMSARRTSQATI